MSQKTNSDEPRHWHDLWACWIGMFPNIQPSEEPAGCAWTHHDTPEALEREYSRLEASYRAEIDKCIDAISSGGSFSPSSQAEYFLGQRWNVILDFLQSLSTKVGDWQQTIIPPCALGEPIIFRWLMRDWWNFHGIQRLVDLELIRRHRYANDV